LAALALVVLALLALAQTGAGRSLMRIAGLTGGGDGSYSELAFTGPSALPHGLPRERTSIAMPFELTNRTGADRSYRWSVVTITGARTTELARGSAEIPADGRATIDPRASYACRIDGRLRIEARVDGGREAIGFWARCSAGATP
jgi:hypothetical protein